MAEVKYSEQPGALISTFTWSGLRNGDRGQPIRNVSGNISFQIDGDFGARGRVVIEASNDGHVYKTVNDRRGVPCISYGTLAQDDPGGGCLPQAASVRWGRGDLGHGDRGVSKTNNVADDTVG